MQSGPLLGFSFGDFGSLVSDPIERAAGASIDPELAATDGVRCLTSAAAHAGPNRLRIRNFLASGEMFTANGQPK